MIILLAASPVFAQDSSEITLCANLGEYAESVFDARNRGVSLSGALTVVYENNPDTDAPIVQVMISIVRAIYEEPHYQSEEMQTQQIWRFRNNLESECLDSL